MKLFVLFLFLLSVKSAFAQMALDYQLNPVSDAGTIYLADIDVNALSEEALTPRFTKSFRYAVSTTVNANVNAHGEWAAVTHQGQAYDIWRLKVVSADALKLEFGFTQFSLPENATLYFYDEAKKPLFRSLTAADNQKHGEYWTPVMPSKVITIELNIPRVSKNALLLHLDNVGQSFIDIQSPQFPQTSLDGIVPKATGACNVDVACDASQGWEDQIQSVARYTWRLDDGYYACSAAAINSYETYPKPYLLTANHCSVSEVNKQTVSVYWNYQNSTCRPIGGEEQVPPGDGSLSVYNSGVELIARLVASDVKLLQLNQPFPEQANVFLAGWDSRNITVPAGAVGIHHPNSEEKRFSQTNTPLTITGTGGSLLRINGWDLGVTEPGSSGSPLFSPEGLIVGQLFGGNSSCATPEADDYYGRVHYSYSNVPAFRNALNPYEEPIDRLAGRYVSEVFTLVASDQTILMDENVIIQLTAENSYAPYTFSASGLPEGLVVSGDKIIGKTSEFGDFEVTVSVQDRFSTPISKVITLTVDPLIPWGFLVDNNYVFSQDENVSIQLATKNALGPLTFSASGLPEGLTVSGDKIIGQTNEVGDFEVTISAQDAFLNTISMVVTLTIEPLPLALLIDSNYVFSQDENVAIQLAAKNGLGPFTFSVSGLPEGLTLNGDKIIGKTNQVGDFDVTVSVQDAFLTSLSAVITLTIESLPLAILMDNRYILSAGENVSIQLAAENGIAPYTFSASGLPEGLTVSGDKIIGQTNQVGDFEVTVSVKDSVDADDSQVTSMTIGRSAIPIPGQQLLLDGFEAN